MLNKDIFLSVIDVAPLVSVDLVVVRSGCQVLFGYRNNRPAQGFWFVPGGRIFKNERIKAALIRIGQKELGMGEGIASGALSPRSLGAFEHFYADSFAGDVGVSTHYVVLGYRLDVQSDFSLPTTDEQHAEFRWWPIERAVQSPEVHQFTKDYLISEVFP